MNRQALALCTASLVLATSQPLLAAEGLAYDSVVSIRLVGAGEVQSIEPDATFEQAFEAAAKVEDDSDPGGILGFFKGIFGLWKAFTTWRSSSQRIFRLGTRFRTDDVSSHTSTIVDCSAKTITNLDQNARTYTVSTTERVTPKQPADDGWRRSATFTTQHLGPRIIDGSNTDGYFSRGRTTATKGKQSIDVSFGYKTFVSNTSQPELTCDAPRPSAAPGMAGDELDVIRDILQHGGASPPNIKIDGTGPAIPAKKLALFTVFQMSFPIPNGSRGSWTLLIRNGHVRTLGPADASLFDVPPGFKRVSGAP